jgi:hypothetical protein
MDYLTQYYKNRAEQLQQELEELTEAVLAQGDPTYYGDETTNVGLGDLFRGIVRGFGTTYNRDIAQELIAIMKNLHPDKLRDSNYMRNFFKRLTKEELAQWKLLFPQGIKVGNGTNGVNGRIYHLYMDGKRQRVIWWDDASGTWRSPGKTGNSPYGEYINGGEVWRPIEATNTVSSVITDEGGNPMTAGPNVGLNTSNKNTVV